MDIFGIKGTLAISLILCCPLFAIEDNMHKIQIGRNILIYDSEGVLQKVNNQSSFQFERSDHAPLQIRVNDKKVEFSILVNNFGERRWESIPIENLNKELEKSFRSVRESGQEREILLYVCQQSSIELLSHLADWLEKNSMFNVHINISNYLFAADPEPIIPPSELKIVPSDTKTSVKVPYVDDAAPYAEGGK